MLYLKKKKKKTEAKKYSKLCQQDNNNEHELQGDNKKHAAEKQKPNISNWNQAIKGCCTKQNILSSLMRHSQ